MHLQRVTYPTTAQVSLRAWKSRRTCRVGELDPDMLQQPEQQVGKAVTCQQSRSPVLPKHLPRQYQPGCCKGHTGQAEVAHNQAQPV